MTTLAQDLVIERLAIAYGGTKVKPLENDAVAVCGWDQWSETQGLRVGPWRVVSGDGTEMILK